IVSSVIMLIVSHDCLCSYSHVPSPIPSLSLHDALPISQDKADVIGSYGLPVNARALHERAQPRICRGLEHLQPLPDKDPVLPCRSEEHTSELQSRFDLVCRLLLEKKNSGENLKGSPKST